jgi:hypothetical protein
VICVGESPRSAGTASTIASDAGFSSAQQRAGRAGSQSSANTGLQRVQWGTPMRCVTDYGVCFLPYPAPIGMSCFCRTVYGPVPGIVL